MRDTFVNRFKKAMEIRDITPSDVSKATKISKSSLSEYLKGDYSPKQDKIFVLANYLNVDYGWLMGADTDMIPSPIGKPVRINVYGSIPAGIPLEAIQDIQDWEEIPEEWTKGGKEYIALKVKGDSMYPKYLEGDTVIILLQQDCESGDDCACYVNGYEATLKKVIKGDGSITLNPINPNYAPQTYKHPGEIKILGIVKELRRQI